MINAKDFIVWLADRAAKHPNSNVPYDGEWQNVLPDPIFLLYPNSEVDNISTACLLESLLYRYPSPVQITLDEAMTAETLKERLPDIGSLRLSWNEAKDNTALVLLDPEMADFMQEYFRDTQGYIRPSSGRHSALNTFYDALNDAYRVSISATLPPSKDYARVTEVEVVTAGRTRAWTFRSWSNGCSIEMCKDSLDRTMRPSIVITKDEHEMALATAKETLSRIIRGKQ